MDAGSHKGEFSTELHNRFGCRCIAIEANPKLAHTIPVPPGGEVISAALGSRDGQATFVFRDNPESGSVFAQKDDLGNSTVPVEVFSLKTVMQLMGLTRIDLLKLDIEGAEFSLIAETPDEVLTSIAQLTVEFHDFLPEFANLGLYEAARARLEHLGFRCFPMALRTHGDVLFLNSKTTRVSLIDSLSLKFIGPWALKFFSGSLGEM